MRLSVTRLTEFPSACRHQAGLGPLASHYSELFGTEGDFIDPDLACCQRVFRAAMPTRHRPVTGVPLAAPYALVTAMTASLASPSRRSALPAWVVLAPLTAHRKTICRSHTIHGVSSSAAARWQI